MMEWMQVLVQSSYEMLRASVEDLRSRLTNLEKELGEGVSSLEASVPEGESDEELDKRGEEKGTISTA